MEYLETCVRTSDRALAASRAHSRRKTIAKDKEINDTKTRMNEQAETLAEQARSYLNLKFTGQLEDSLEQGNYLFVGVC
jgi:phosphate uptake regulator